MIKNPRNQILFEKIKLFEKLLGKRLFYRFSIFHKNSSKIDEIYIKNESQLFAFLKYHISKVFSNKIWFREFFNVKKIF